jgi:NDP-sugar pyrophosphorylase family protein
VYILSSELLNRLGSEMRFVKDFSTEVLTRFVGKIYSFETSALFLDIGTPDSYAQANISNP